MTQRKRTRAEWLEDTQVVVVIGVCLFILAATLGIAR